MHPLDFYDRNPYAEAESLLGRPGRMMINLQNPTTVKNANVLANRMKIWYGDLDYHQRAKDLQTLANQLGVTIYVLREADARWGTEENPPLDRAVATFKPEAS